jgi:hypothetical protein
MFAHKTNKSRKLLFETGKIRSSSFVKTDDSQGHCRATTRCSSSIQVRLDGGEA